MSVQENPTQEEQIVEQNREKEKKKTTDKSILETFLSIVKELFIFSLIFYLILFILETIFPGFVSYNFNLNWFLGLVLVLGIISAFGPEESKEEKGKEKPKIIDYLTSIFLGILGGILIFYKINLEFFPRVTISIISGILIIVFSLVLLFIEDEEIEEKEEEIELFVQNTFLSRKNFIAPIAFFRLLIFKKVNFPLFLILIVFLFTTLALPQKSGTIPRQLNLGKLTSFFKSATPPKQTDQPPPTPTPPTPTPPTPTPSIGPSAEILVKVLNGGGEKSVVSDFVNTLKNRGFAKVFFGDADNFEYKNVTLKFRPEDKDQASLIKDLLKDEYSLISEVPSGTTSAEMTVILGAKESEKLEEVTILTPE